MGGNERDGRSDESLFDVLSDKVRRSHLGDEERMLVLAAFDSDAALERAANGVINPQERPRIAAARTKPPKAFLEKITVRSFRGVGAEVSLNLQASPGLTLVVGRNGSGKSSFAEAVETALTGTSYRWKDKTKDWKSGWRNLHDDAKPSIDLDLSLDGESGRTTVSRTWLGNDVDKSRCRVARPNDGRASLSSLGWESALTMHRPFLSYAELGQIISGRPSEMYDALASILGLEQITAAEGRLRGLKQKLEAEAKLVQANLHSLRTELAHVDDDRARKAHAALQEQAWDLDRVAELAAGSATAEPAGQIEALRRMAHLDHPDRDQVAGAWRELRRAATVVEAAKGTESEGSRELADLLERALTHYKGHGGRSACPVCGTEGVLDSSWAARTSTQIGQLRKAAAEADGAHQAVRRAMSRGRALVTEPPPWLPAGEVVHEAWLEWARGGVLEDPTALADHLEVTFPPLRDACTQASETAARQLAEIEDRWRPMALRLGTWVENARKIQDKQRLRADIKKAYDWLRDTGLALRNDRLQPLAAESAEVWQELRQESNVELGPISLVGRPPGQRKVALDVTVDGIDATAVGVMSQGELHALGLALFLPRATVSESPFRFLVIDDPVQSMDPAKVDGLARVLSRAARDRQVIVFTHDARLPNAIRRLDLPATVWEVMRRENSRVELRRADDPASRALGDARALLRAKELPDSVAPRVVPGFCRSALEACLVELIWRRRLDEGTSAATIAGEIDSARGTYDLAALAYFGDTGRTGDVLARVNQYGRWAGDTFQACKSAGHEPYSGDLNRLVKDSEKLVERIRAER